MTYNDFLIREGKAYLRRTYERENQTHRRLVNYLIMQKHAPAVEQYLTPLTSRQLDDLIPEGR